MKLAIMADSPSLTQALRRLIEPLHQQAWQALSLDEASQHLSAEEPPDLLLQQLDSEADLECVRRLQAIMPCPVLLFTTLAEPRADLVFAALGLGARDVVDLPGLGARSDMDSERLLRRIRNIGLLSGSFMASTDAATASAPLQASAPRAMAEPWPTLVAIGASAGGPATINTLLGNLRANCRCAIVLVQHLDDRFSAGMAEWLARECALPVRLARAREAPQPGAVLLASGNSHLCLEHGGELVYSDEPAGLPYRPSVDVFMHSVARYWRGPAVGVLLTGMGNDGAQGLKAMRERGFTTIAQDRASSAVWGMPKAAVEINAATEVLPLSRIAGRLQELCP
ncbi:chemotaxis-specific protein-glutamate methyltransferase CheB [Acidovorax sp.]|uniref:chemotaxis-specific protein-glutamate methyltransferase CheB n=1 Tax=Acidovorax sp. TaxID=1872122 RepID=UPI002627668D|nr:chemotaxis-specific protein-glutamate methyltransferase CheB [Acidovorax sp.]